MKCVEGEFTKLIEWSPAWDKRNPDPSKNYGIHGMNLRFVLIGPKGATQFLVYTNWMLPQNRKDEEMVKAYLLEPLPADIGYHAHVPQYEDQKPFTDHCEYLDDQLCYYDGSSLQSKVVFDRFVEFGEEVVWDELHKRYDELKE